MSDQDLDATVNRWDRADTGGVAVAVLQGGALRYTRAVGMASIEYGIANTLDTRFRIASITKQFLSYLVLQLVEEGLLDLDADLRGDVPALHQYRQAISLRHILSNVSGILDIFDLLVLRGQEIETPMSDAAVDAMLARQTVVNFAPGDAFLYSNSGFRFTARLAEQRTGQTLEELFQTRIFKPLGMQSSALCRSARQVVPGLATGYLAGADGSVIKAGHGLSFNGDGGLVSTVNDLLRWERALPGLRAQGEKVLDVLTRPTVFNNGATGVYGLGMLVRRWRGQQVTGHGGLLPGFTSQILRLPEQDVSIVVLSNSSDVNAAGIADQAAYFLLDGAVPAAGSTAAFASRAGKYLDTRRDELLEIIADAGVATVKMHGTAFPLEIEATDRARVHFSVLDRQIAIEADGLALIECGESYKLHQLDAAAAESDLARYVGTFHSAELESTFLFATDVSGLRLTIAGPYGRASYLLEWLAPALFRASTPADSWFPHELVIRFVGDATPGAIRIVSGRTKGIEMRRDAQPSAV